MDIPVICTDTMTSRNLENYNHMNFISALTNDQNYFLDTTQPIIENQTTGDQSKNAAVNVPRAQEDQIVPTPKEPQEKKKVCENPTVETIQKSCEKRKKILTNLVTEIKNRNKKHPVEILFESFAKTVMNFSPALAAEAQLKINSILIDLKYRSLVTQAQERNFVSCSPSRDSALEYCSSSSETPSSEYCQSYNSNSRLCTE